jgi:hypothetical protein
MQDSFVDRLFSFIWLVLTSAFTTFLYVVSTVDAKFGDQTGGFILMLVSIVTTLILWRRSFYRRGVGGLEGFSSFTKVMIVIPIEGIVGLFASGCFFSGLYFLGRHYFHY